jgi:hypothetical protein
VGLAARVYKTLLWVLGYYFLGVAGGLEEVVKCLCAMKFHPHLAFLFVLISESAFSASTPNPDNATPMATAIATATSPAEAADLPLTPVIKDGLSVLIEPVKQVVSVSGTLVVKVTYRNVSKTAFRLPNQVVFHPPGGAFEADRSGAFWQLTLQESATGKTYASFDNSKVEDLIGLGIIVKASAVIQPGESLVTMVALDGKQFHLEGQDLQKWPYSMGFIGPTGGFFSNVGNYIPTGTYKLIATIRFPVKPAPDQDSTPLWKDDSIQANPIEITFAPEGSEYPKSHR